MKMQLNQQRLVQPVTDFRQARNPRERLILALAAGLIVLALIYLALIEPAMNARTQLIRSVPQLRQQVAEMQTLAKEAQSLPAPAEQNVTPVTREMVQAALNSHDLKAQSLNVNGGVVQVQFSDVAFSNLLAWLGSLRGNAMLEVTDANIVAQSQPDRVNATLTLRQQASE